jgi:hypothetical protein
MEDHMTSAPPAGKRRFSNRQPREKQEAKILFQQFFKSVGPRTYAAQLKEAGNGNHFLVLTEGKRDEKTGEVRKTRLFIFSEDFGQFFRLLKETAEFIREHPVSTEVKQRQERYWKKQQDKNASPVEQDARRPGAPEAGNRDRQRPRAGPRFKSIPRSGAIAKEHR